MTKQGTVWVGTGSGLYHSADGKNWGLLFPQLENRDIAGWFVNPEDPDQIFAAGSNGIMRTLDGGVNWAEIGEGLPDPAAVSSFTGYEEDGQIHLFAFISGEGIYRSTDAGENWQLWSQIDQEVYAMDFHPEENRLCAAAQFSLLCEEDGKWRSVDLPQAEQIYSLAVNRETGALAVATEQGVFEKKDDEWERLDAESPEKLIVVSPGAKNVNWVGLGESALIYMLEKDKWILWNG
jgi:photosystem II stability/assembly factor-like uncharacterized protein